MGETRGDHSIDIAINSGDKSSNNSSSSSKPCIFEVPVILYRHSPKSFTPNSFSIGPLHHTQEHLKATEEIKKHYLAKLLSRKPTSRTTQEEFKRSILEVEGRARKCYAFPTDHLDKDKFVDMLILDGCFIIELLRNNEISNKKNENSSSSNNNNNISSSNNNNNKNNNNNNSNNNNNNKNNNNNSNNNKNNSSSSKNNNNTIDEDDPVFSVGWVLQVLYHDLILLENQIPWFVLKCLFEMTSEKKPDTKSLTELALDFFGTIFSGKALPSIPDDVEINHILDLIRNSLAYSSVTQQQSSGDWQQIPTATSLKESGIRFKKRETSKLLDIEFGKHGVLEIPSLLIQETTCQAFRNLISYEQCYPNCEPKITSYTVLLNNLINTTKDIEVLREAGVVDNWLNPNDTLEFFKNIYTDTYVKKFYYVKICQDVNVYTNRFWPKARAAYVRNHFADPWVIASEIVAGIVVILTILQTYCTVMEYNKKDSSHSPPPPS